MQTRKRSIEQIVEEQVQRWNFFRREPSREKRPDMVITISREPGSGGDVIARDLAERLNLDLFHQKVIHEMARSAHVSRQIVQSLDEKGLNFVEDWIASLIHRRHLWPDEYLQHLLKVLGTIGKHGNALIVGRGANFVLPAKDTLRLRIIAPRSFRAQKVSETYGIPLEDAKRRILKTESERRAFIRKYFHEDISDPANYDMIMNTGTMTINESVECVCSIIGLRG